MAKIFLSLADVAGTVSDNNTFVYGHNENKVQNIAINAGVSNVTLDANIDQLTLTGNHADYQFFQAGNSLKIVQNGVTISNIYIQDDSDGTQLSFKDKTITAKFGFSNSGVYLDVGGQIVNKPISSDSLPPKIVSFSPADNSLDVLINTNITINFNEPVKASSGYIVINGTDTRAISITDKTQVTINGSSVVINPSSDLKLNNFYSVQIVNGVIQDLAGNNFAGISDTTTFNFKTEAGLALTGKAIDGYLAGATVTMHGSDGKTYTTTTDANGNFAFPAGTPQGSLTTTGGTDLSTGKPFKGVLKAPAGSTMITPLTTLVQGFVEKGKSVEEATKSVGKALGIDVNKVDLVNFDPIQAVKDSSTGTTGDKTFFSDVLKEAGKVASMLVKAAESLTNSAKSNVNLEDLIDGIVESIVTNAEKSVSGVLDLNSANFLQTVLTQSASFVDVEIDLSKLTQEATDFATKMVSFASKIDALVFDEHHDEFLNAFGDLIDDAQNEPPPSETISAPVSDFSSSSSSNSSTTSSTNTNGTRTSPVTTQTSGDDVLNSNQGTILGTAVAFNAANGNDEYVVSTIKPTGGALPAAHVSISGFSAASGDTLVFDVANTSTGFTTVDALYAVSDNGTDISMIVNDDGNIQLITLTGQTGARTGVGGSVDSMTELSAFLGTGSIEFI